MSRPRLSRRWLLLAALVVLVGVLAGALLLGRPTSSPPERAGREVTLSPTAHEMAVADLLRAGERGGVVLVLRERGRGRLLPLTIGEMEGLSMLTQLDSGIAPPRPLTHDLMATVLGELRAEVVRAVVTDLRDGTFYARLVLRAEGRELEIDARPSDAIALALRAKAPIYVEAQVLDQAGMSTEQTF
jgi:bifunctional DNase/RNase